MIPLDMQIKDVKVCKKNSEVFQQLKVRSQTFEEWIDSNLFRYQQSYFEHHKAEDCPDFSAAVKLTCGYLWICYIGN